MRYGHWRQTIIGLLWRFMVWGAVWIKKSFAAEKVVTFQLHDIIILMWIFLSVEKERGFHALFAVAFSMKARVIQRSLPLKFKGLQMKYLIWNKTLHLKTSSVAKDSCLLVSIKSHTCTRHHMTACRLWDCLRLKAIRISLFSFI